MAKKTANSIKATDEISKNILDKLKSKQGNQSLYKISTATGFHAGTLRRKLENSDGWREVKLFFKVADFLGNRPEDLLPAKLDGIPVVGKRGNKSVERDLIKKLETKIVKQEAEILNMREILKHIAKITQSEVRKSRKAG